MAEMRLLVAATVTCALGLSACGGVPEPGDHDAGNPGPGSDSGSADAGNLCDGVGCNSHGSCNAGNGRCDCATGFDPAANCSTCLAGFTGADCRADLCYQKTCNGHGTCKAATGICECNAGFAGTACETCDSAHLDYPTCRDNPCEPDPCNGHGLSCDTANGNCACQAGYESAQSCGACLPNYQGYPGCVINLCFQANCHSHGSCNAGTGTCDCNPSWDTLTGCNSCVSGYQDNDSNGTCLAACAAGTCNGHGTCSDSSGTATCSCTGNWGPATNCSACLAGFYVNGSGNCVTDHCFGVTCDDGNPCNGTETCNQATGCVAGTPVTCADDGNVCNGSETCDTGTGTCIHVTPLTCDDGLACNGTETCNPTAGCVSGTPVSCNGTHGTCQEPTASCLCAAGFDPAVNCSACLAGYGGANCDPVPTISGLAINCSGGSLPGWCALGDTYPVSWNFTNATSFTTSLVKISGCTPTNGILSPTGGGLSGNSHTTNYTLGNCGPSTVRITVTVTGLGGQVSASIDVIYS